MPISNKTRLFDFLRTLITVEQWFNFHIFLSRIFAKVCELKAFNLNIFHASILLHLSPNTGTRKISVLSSYQENDILLA